ncbi:MAG TPA: hypothetical protein VLA16_24480, partial [Ideonella sp.]|nr:hypothetical protein [Ideonella sp.]
MQPSPQLAFTIRRAEPADALCIGVLGMQVFLDTYATEGIRPAIAREVLESLAPEVIESLLAEPGVRFYVAELEGHLIAFAELAAGAAHVLATYATPTELRRLYV